MCSTVTTWTCAGEVDAFRNMLTRFPKGPVSVVSDSYDVWNACENLFGEELHDLVVQRGSQDNSRLVIRPDSGDPKTVVIKVIMFVIWFSSLCIFNLLPSYLHVATSEIMWPHLRCDVGLQEWEYWKKLSLCYSIVYNGAKVRAVLTGRSTV